MITEDAGLSEALWARIKDFLPHRVRAPYAGDPTAFGPSTEREWEAVGLNECWRLAKYFPEDQFMGHLDAAYSRSYDEMSMFTVNIYMNDVAVEHGGATRFYEDDEDDNEVRRREKEGGRQTEGGRERQRRERDRGERETEAREAEKDRQRDKQREADRGRQRERDRGERGREKDRQRDKQREAERGRERQREAEIELTEAQT